MGNANSGRRARRPLRPATTVQGRENQMISLAEQLAERQLREGTAPAQVVTHYLKLGSSRERLEQVRIEHEIMLLSGKVEQINSGQRMEELYKEALGAMREYKGESLDDGYEN